LATLTEDLALFALRLRWEDIPDDVVALAKEHLLDTLGVVLASSRFDFGEAMHAAVCTLGVGDEATALGFGTRLPAASAALVNGTLAHGLDFDDSHIEGIYKPSAPAASAAFASAELAGATGRELLLAYIIGLEIGCRLAAAAPGAFHDRGWHPTGLCGAFACAAVAARLAADPEIALVNAFGLCGSQAAGILEFRDSWLKRMHPGWAAHAGLVAAALGRHGFRGPATVLEGRHGFYATHLGTIPDASVAPTRDLGTRWTVRGIALKPYPFCHFIQGFVDAALVLRETEGFRAEDVERVDCPLDDRLQPIVGEPRELRVNPPTIYDALFSVPYLVSLALVKGRADMAALYDEPLDDPRILALAARVWCPPDPSSDYPRRWPGEVVITLRDGRRLRRCEPVTRGGPERPLSAADVEAKFFENATRAVTDAQARQIVKSVQKLETLPSVNGLIAVCVRRP
jgi:2-methylcitrate dehydratase PrpD